MTGSRSNRFGARGRRRAAVLGRVLVQLVWTGGIAAGIAAAALGSAAIRARADVGEAHRIREDLEREVPRLQEEVRELCCEEEAGLLAATEEALARAQLTGVDRALLARTEEVLGRALARPAAPARTSAPIPRRAGPRAEAPPEPGFDGLEGPTSWEGDRR